MIHRAVYGSIDRFIGIVIEHFSGALPVWLSPVQAKLLPVSEQHLNYALEVKQALENAGIRTEVDLRNEKLGLKIREAQLQKVPYMLVLGDNEQNSGTVSVRTRAAGDSGALGIDEIVRQIVAEISQRS
ncbi:Threonine--tRNA ligase [compost metagenome]